MTNSADPDQLATDLDLYCLQRQGISGFSKTRVNILFFFTDTPDESPGTCANAATMTG